MVSNYGDILEDGVQGCQVLPRDRLLDLYNIGFASRENSGKSHVEGLDGYGVRRRGRLFFVKCQVGIAVAQARGYMVRTFALTESDYAICEGLKWSKAVDKLRKKMKYDYGEDIGIAWVEHMVTGKLRRNRHIVQWGKAKLDLDDLNDYWLKSYGSLVTWRKKSQGGMVVHSAAECARYLSRYLVGEGYVNHRFGYNWVFSGWFDFSRWSRRVYGEYPSVSELAELAGLSAIGRLAVSKYRAWYDTLQGTLQRKWADRIIGQSANEVRWLAEYRKRHHRNKPLCLGASRGY